MGLVSTSSPSSSGLISETLPPGSMQDSEVMYGCFFCYGHWGRFLLKLTDFNFCFERRRSHKNFHYILMVHLTHSFDNK